MKSLKNDSGEVTVMVVVFMAAILMVGGFMVDAGRSLTARRELNDVAAESARAAAQEINRAAAAEGLIIIDDRAVARGEEFLASQSIEGSIEIDGDSVVVRTSGEFSPIMFLGFGDRTIEGEGTARAVRGDSSPDN